MVEHTCAIGLLHHYEGAELVTLELLEDHIMDNRWHNEMLSDDPLLSNCKELYCKEWSIKDYADFRKNTDLTRFRFCPYCGKAIDWKKIKER